MIAAGAGNLLSALIKSAFNLAGGLVSAFVLIVTGVAVLQKKLLMQGFRNVFFQIAGTILIIAAGLVLLFQKILLLQSAERRLSLSEKAMLTDVFGTSLSLPAIRITEGRSGVFGKKPTTAVAIGNLIIANRISFYHHPAVLIHEAVHAWQYQHLGVRYIAEALFAQLRYGRGNGNSDAYDWRAEPERGRAVWKNFNYEAAAQFVEDHWKEKNISGYYRQVLEEIQSYRNFRLSMLLYK
jgi:hypothetical protein